MAKLPMVNEEKYKVVYTATSGGASLYSTLLENINTNFQRLSSTQQRKSVLIFNDAQILRPYTLGRFTAAGTIANGLITDDMDIINKVYRRVTVTSTAVTVTDNSSTAAPSGTTIKLAIYE